MASGDVLDRTGGSFAAVLLDAVGTGATNDGVWVDCGEYMDGTVVVTGPATTTVVTVNCHNGVPTAGDMLAPTNVTVGVIKATGGAGAAVLAEFASLPKFLKCAITATGTGTVTAVLYARKY